jgi:hypothetical protein
MKHKVRIFEVDRTGKPDSPPQEKEPLEVEAGTLASAREQANRVLVDAGWQVRAISHAVDGGLVAYVMKPEEKPRQRRHRARRESELLRK